MKPPTKKQGTLAIAAGTRFGRYDIRSRLGAGGMAEVYPADDTSLHRQVAIKVLTGQSAGDSHAQRRLLREAQAAAMTNGEWVPCRAVPSNGSSAGARVGPSDAACTDAAWSPDGQTVQRNLYRIPIK